VKNNFRSSLSILVLMLVLVSVFTGVSFAEKVLPEEEKYITVNLNINQQEKYKPDVVDVVVGFENEDYIHERAIEKNNKISNKLMELLENKNLENVQTQRFRVYPRTKYDSNRNHKVDYYRVSNQIKFTTTKLGQLPVILGDLLKAGANNVESINYRLEDNKKAMDKVTDMALKNLQTKSENIVSGLGKEKYEIESINFGNQRVYSRGLSESMNMTKSMSAGSSMSSNVPVSEQDVEIRVSLNAKIRVY
jgi:hypothetical protein